MTRFPTVRTILILAANPKNTPPLRLGEEVRKIDEALRRSNQRENFKLEQRWAVQREDFHRAMLDFSPQIVHFCGHGENRQIDSENQAKRKLITVSESSDVEAIEGLVFEDERDQAVLVNSVTLGKFFELFASRGVECVVLNACYSEVQAKAIRQHIPYVIGMSQAIGDKAAIVFSTAFYDTLGAGETYEFAFKLARVAIQVAGISEYQAPVLKQLAASPTPQRRTVSCQSLNFSTYSPETWVGRDELIITLARVFPKIDDPEILGTSR